MFNIENQTLALIQIHPSGIRIPNLCIYTVLKFLRKNSERIYSEFIYKMRVAIYRCFDDDIDDINDENVYRYG